MKLPLRKAFVTLGLLVFLAGLNVFFVWQEMTLLKEFFGPLAGGITGVVATLYAIESRDKIKEKIDEDSRS